MFTMARDLEFEGCCGYARREYRSLRAQLIKCVDSRLDRAALPRGIDGGVAEAKANAKSLEGEMRNHRLPFSAPSYPGAQQALPVRNRFFERGLKLEGLQPLSPEG